MLLKNLNVESLLFTEVGAEKKTQSRSKTDSALQHCLPVDTNKLGKKNLVTLYPKNICTNYRWCT